MTTVLLVDDEKLILRSLEKTLLRAGFDVLTASDCKSGSEIFSQNIRHDQHCCAGFEHAKL